MNLGFGFTVVVPVLELDSSNLLDLVFRAAEEQVLEDLLNKHIANDCADECLTLVRREEKIFPSTCSSRAS